MTEQRQNPPTDPHATGQPPSERQPRGYPSAPTPPPQGQYPPPDYPQRPPGYPQQPPPGYPQQPPPGYPQQPPDYPQQPPDYPQQPPDYPQQPPGYPQQPPDRPQQPPDYPQPPPPTKCPDPCEPGGPWGPPTINPDCWPDDRGCCPKDAKGKVTWDEVDDPCVRASACCPEKSTKISCTCQSSNPDATCAGACAEWGCDSGLDGLCVPCEPCKDLIPDPDPKEPQKPENGDDGCGAEALRRQLEADRTYVLAKEAEKAKIEADLKARSDRDKELEALIKDFEKIIGDYKSKRHDLICREDCLKGFHREASTFFEHLSEDCKTKLNEVINHELCELERAKCCQKNLEWKLKKTTPLIRKQEAADRALKDAEAAFKDIKDLSKWIGAQFTELEGFQKEIVAAINDKDPEKHKWAFYLFYWKYVPALCKRFKVAICCKKKKAADDAPATAPSGDAPVHIGCVPGDWYPSQIKDDTLTKLICCAWDDVKEKKGRLQDVNAEVDAATKNLDSIKKKVDTDTKALNDRIKSKIEPVCPTAGSK